MQKQCFVDITENVHPADLEVEGVCAELIGNEYDHGESNIWSTPFEQNSIHHLNTSNYAMASHNTEFERWNTSQNGHHEDSMDRLGEYVSNVAVAVAERIPHGTSHPGVEGIFCSEEQSVNDYYQESQHIQSSNITLYGAEDRGLVVDITVSNSL
jgi:hypothetical protein